MSWDRLNQVTPPPDFSIFQVANRRHEITPQKVSQSDPAVQYHFLFPNTLSRYLLTELVQCKSCHSCHSHLSSSITPHLSAVNHFWQLPNSCYHQSPPSIMTCHQSSTLAHTITTAVIITPAIAHLSTINHPTDDKWWLMLMSVFFYSLLMRHIQPRDDSYCISNVTPAGCVPSPVASL